MLKVLNFISIIFLYLNCQTLNAKGKFTLNVKVPVEFDGSEAVLRFQNTFYSDKKTIVKNGAINLSGESIHSYELVYLSLWRGSDFLGAINFFITSGKIRIQINANSKLIQSENIIFTDAPFEEEKKVYESKIKPLEDSLLKLSRTIQDLKNNVVRDSYTDSLQLLYRKKIEESKSFKIKFIKENSNKYISLYYFEKEILNNGHFFQFPHDSLKSLFNMFSIKLRKSDLGKSITTYFSKRESLLVNSALTDFAFKTKEGVPYKLSSFRKQKYVLISFWDSWCTPCIKKFPLFKKIDSLYSEKGLQLLSISIDGTTEKWLTSLERHKLPWLQTCDLTPYVASNKMLRDAFDIKYIPQYFLIDKNGIIIYHNSQSNDNDELDVLQNLLKMLLFR